MVAINCRPQKNQDIPFFRPFVQEKGIRSDCAVGGPQILKELGSFLPHQMKRGIRHRIAAFFFFSHTVNTGVFVHGLNYCIKTFTLLHGCTQAFFNAAWDVVSMCLKNSAMMVSGWVRPHSGVCCGFLPSFVHSPSFSHAQGNVLTPHVTANTIFCQK